MRSFYVIIFAIAIMAGCTKIENNYFYCISYDEDGECIEWAEIDTDPKTDSIVSDNEIDENTDTDLIVGSDESFEDTDLLPDDDNFVDYCSNITDTNGESIVGEYKDNPGNSEETTVSIELVSLQKEKTCKIIFTSYFYPILEEIIVQTTSLPLNRYPVSFNGDDCFLFLKFLDITNTLSVEINMISDGKSLLDQNFSRK